MYKIVVQKFGEEPRAIIAENNNELKEVVISVLKTEREILSVKKVDCDYAKDYLKEIKEILKSKDDENLVYGKNKLQGIEVFLREQLSLIAKYLFHGKLRMSAIPVLKDDSILYYEVFFEHEHGEVQLYISLLDAMEWRKRRLDE